MNAGVGKDKLGAETVDKEIISKTSFIQMRKKRH